MKYYKRWLILLAIILLVNGCDSGRDDYVFTPNVGSQTTTPVTGKVFLGAPVPGIAVRLQDVNGQILAETTSDATGNFSFAGPVPEDFRLLATLADGTTFAREVRDHSQAEYAVINVPTTLVSLSSRSQPGVPLSEIENRVRGALDIPAGFGLNIMEESTHQPFSHIAFFGAAAKSGSPSAFYDQFLGGNSTPRAFLLRPETIDGSLMGVDSLLIGLLEEVRARPAKRQAVEVAFLHDLFAPSTGVRARTRTSAPLATADREQILAQEGSNAAVDLLSGVGTGLVTNIAQGGIDVAYTYMAEKLGWNFGTTVELDEILSTLNQVQDGITSIIQTDLGSAYTTPADALDKDYAEAITTQVGQETTAITSIYIPAAPGAPAGSGTLKSTNTGVGYLQNVPIEEAPTSEILNLVSTLTTNQMRTSLDEIMQDMTGNAPTSVYPLVVVNTGNTSGGDTNLVTLARNYVLSEAGVDDSAATQKWMNWPVRSNALINGPLAAFGKYAQYQILGSQVLSEAAHANATPGKEIPTQQIYIDNVVRSLYSQRAQLPAIVPSDDILVDLQYGLIWYLPTQNAVTSSQAITNAKNFSLQLSNGETYGANTWRLPSYNECKALQQRGYATSGATDYGKTLSGLSKLGFDVSGINSDGDIWYQEWIPQGGSSWVKGTTPSEFRLTHESSNQATKHSDDTRPYLLVRSIGDPLIYIDPPGLTGQQNNFPSEMSNQVHSWELPYLGTCDGLSNPSSSVFFGGSEVAAHYHAYVGGNFLIGGTANTQINASTNISKGYSGDYSVTPATFTEVVNNTLVYISNYPAQWGEVTPLGTSNQSTGMSFHTLGLDANLNFPSQITATTNVDLQGNVPPIQLDFELQIAPGNFTILSSGTNLQFSSTGFFDDGTVEDLTSTTQWTVVDKATNQTVPGAYFNTAPGGEGELIIDRTLLNSSDLVVTANATSGQARNQTQTDVFVVLVTGGG